MDRFYYDDPDNENEHFFKPEQDDDDEDDEAVEFDGEVISFVDQQGMLDVMHMDLAQVELYQHLLAMAIEIAEKSWFWRFKGVKAKMEEIDIIYRRLIEMNDLSNHQEGKEE